MERTKIVQVRMTPAERELARERARGAGKTVSEYVRGLMLGRPAPKKSRGAAALEGGSPGGDLGAAIGELEPAAGVKLDGRGREVYGMPVELDRTLPPGGFEIRAAPVFRCPSSDATGPCDFTARSPKVSCRVHGTKVVPA